MTLREHLAEERRRHVELLLRMEMGERDGFVGRQKLEELIKAAWGMGYASAASVTDSYIAKAQEVVIRAAKVMKEDEEGGGRLHRLWRRLRG